MTVGAGLGVRRTKEFGGGREDKREQKVANLFLRQIIDFALAPCAHLVYTLAVLLPTQPTPYECKFCFLLIINQLTKT